MGIVEWLKDKWNDDTLDPAFVEMEDEFTDEWRIWAKENGYDLVDEIPDEILKTSQNSPYLKCDDLKISFPLARKHDGIQIHSFYLEKEFNNFLSSSIHTYNCLVAATRFDIGKGQIDMEAELEGLMGGGEKYKIKIDSDSKRYTFKINGKPERLVDNLFTDEMSKLLTTFDEVHMSYINSTFFLVRPMPRTITRPRIEKAHHPFKFDPGVEIVLEIKQHRRWNSECIRWIEQIIDLYKMEH